MRRGRCQQPGAVRKTAARGSQNAGEGRIVQTHDYTAARLGEGGDVFEHADLVLGSGDSPVRPTAGWAGPGSGAGPGKPAALAARKCGHQPSSTPSSAIAVRQRAPGDVTGRLRASADRWGCRPIRAVSRAEAGKDSASSCRSSPGAGHLAAFQPVEHVNPRRMEPWPGGRRPASVCRVSVLPTPFGPSTAMTSLAAR